MFSASAGRALPAPLPCAAPAASAAGRVGTVRVTVDTPSTNLVRKRVLALLNMPSLSDTTMNCGVRSGAATWSQHRCTEECELIAGTRACPCKAPLARQARPRSASTGRSATGRPPPRPEARLGVWEVGLNHAPDVLGVAQVQGRVHLVQDVDRGRLRAQRDRPSSVSRALKRAPCHAACAPHSARVTNAP